MENITIRSWDDIASSPGLPRSSPNIMQEGRQKISNFFPSQIILGERSGKEARNDRLPL